MRIKSQNMLMTDGPIWKQLILYSIPLLAGNLFQQLYNTVDSVVVGNFISDEALAAVGSSTSLINLIIGMFMGIATGAGVLISQYYGGHQQEKMSWAVHTSMMLSVYGGLVLIVVGMLFSPVILRWMGTPPEVLPDSVTYFRIFFAGSMFNLVYNMGSGILRAVGDSMRPLYYLIAASVVNIVLDLLFVLGIGMGVEGVAYATVAAQLLSAVLTVRELMRTDDIYKLELKKLRVDRRMAARIVKLGIPSGIQQSIISASNVIVQANINSYGAMVMAGYGAYMKLEGFVLLPLQSFCMAATTFTGQNIGARKRERVKQGMVQGIIICMVYTGVLIAALMPNGEVVLRIFSSSEDVIYWGAVTMRYVLPYFLLLTFHQIFMGTFRGAGKSMESMLIAVGNMCVLRMIYINFVVPFFPSYEAVILCYPITWAGTLIMDILYLWKGKWLPQFEGIKE